MSKTKDFFNRYDGKPLDFDGYYGTQCVDVIMQFTADVLKIPRWGSGNAVGRWTDYPTAHFERIANTASFVPRLGDIVVWGTWSGNPYGHIAIATGEGDTNRFVAFGANWPVGDVCGYDWYSYANVLGVLRFKNQSVINDDMSQAEREELNWLRNRWGQVQANKTNEFRIEGQPTVYQVYAIPDIGHFESLGNKWENVRQVPADFPLDPAKWAGQREWLRPAVQQAEASSAANERKALEADTALQQEKQRHEQTKISLGECENALHTPCPDCPECPDCPPTSVPVVEMPQPPKVTLEDILAAFFKKLFRKR